MIRKSIVKYQIHWTWLYKCSPFIPFFQHLAPMCGARLDTTIAQTCHHIVSWYYSANFNEFMYCMLNRGSRDYLNKLISPYKSRFLQILKFSGRVLKQPSNNLGFGGIEGILSIIIKMQVFNFMFNIFTVFHKYQNVYIFVWMIAEEDNNPRL